eukprot:CAMPEP_0117463750 /NCGR_PEP_ID=MMETSP0784-20121206/3743_1 /TAXON_ID=39447 /ORGANISM="" /LENGTH=374 /DNA_ID=CAMNT_0005257581 /DNA_START=46 /DNA_END=1167 /DNA_ORIENTATION=-
MAAAEGASTPEGGQLKQWLPMFPLRGRGNGVEATGGTNGNVEVEPFLQEALAQLKTLKGVKQHVSFPVSLSSQQRKYIHKLAEGMGLDSKSSGDGDNRYITVYTSPLADIETCKRNTKGVNATGEEKSWDERLSRTLASILRHRAQEEGLCIGSDGFTELREVLALRSLQLLGATEAEVVRYLSDSDAKKRFTLRRREDGVWMIRACQGHTMKFVKDEQLLRRVVSAQEFPACVHGTYCMNWHLIKASGGLSRMARNHIHFAPRPPGHDGVISGMRDDCDVAIYLDMASALKAGIAFYASDNDVILSPGDKAGMIPLRHVKRVQWVNHGGVIWPLDTLDHAGSERDPAASVGMVTGSAATDAPLINGMETSDDD